MALNRFIIIGNLTRDVELKFTGKGTAVADFGLASSRVWFDAAGKKMEDTLFIDVTVWERGAEWASEQLKKGVEVCAEGYLKLDRWEDKQTGQPRTKIGMVAERLVPTFGTWKDRGDRPAREHNEDEEGARSTRAPGQGPAKQQGEYRAAAPVDKTPAKSRPDLSAQPRTATAPPPAQRRPAPPDEPSEEDLASRDDIPF